LSSFVISRIKHALAVTSATGVLAGGLIAAAAVPAGASTLSCGDVLTSSVTLHHDLDCSAFTSGPALVVNAPGVTVDLNGHHILGPGSAASTPGILAGFSRDRVTDGSISDFVAAVAVTPPGSQYLHNVVLSDLKITESTPGLTFGIFAGALDHSIIRHVAATSTYVGIALFASRHSTVSDNTLKSDFYGAADESGVRNTFSDNKTSTHPNGAGILLATTKGDALKHNRLGGQGSAGLIDETSTSLDVSRNTVSHLLYGIILEGTANSEVSHNQGTANGWGLALENNNGIDAISNTFGSGGYGIEADYPASLMLKHNRTSHNSQIGTYISDGGQPLPSYSALVSFNTANFSSAGFYSQFPATGHGNDADHNTVLGCFNVSCIHGMSKLHASMRLPAHHAFPVPALPKRPALKK